MTDAESKLNSELESLFEDPPTDLPYSVNYWDPVNEDIFHWRAIFIGPEGTPYENGAFEAEIKFDKDYPKIPPKITFKTRIYNCNIDPNDGTVCVSLLTNWKIDDPKHEDYIPPKLKNIREVLFAVSILFYEQNPISPMNWEAAQLYKKEDKTDFNNKVKKWVNFYAEIENEVYKDKERQKQNIY